jgi:hypothetical protein
MKTLSLAVALFLACLSLARAQDVDAEAIRLLVQDIDHRIDTTAHGSGKQQMIVTLEARLPKEDYIKRLVNFAHDPIEDKGQALVPLHRVVVDYLSGDSVHHRETYYYLQGSVVFASVMLDTDECQGVNFYFRKHNLILVEEWEGAGCKQETLLSSYAGRKVPEERLREGLFRQLQAREYLAAFNSFCNTLLSY